MMDGSLKETQDLIKECQDAIDLLASFPVIDTKLVFLPCQQGVPGVPCNFDVSKREVMALFQNRMENLKSREKALLGYLEDDRDSTSQR